MTKPSTNLDHAEDLSRRLRALIAPAVAEEGLDLWDLRFSGSADGGGTLAVFVDRAEGGASLDDCAAVSRKLSLLLDMEDLIAGAYNLEVSTPGLDRTLCRPEHFRRFVGHRLKLRLHEPLEGRRVVAGVLQASTAEGITFHPDNDDPVDLAFDAVERANLVVDFGTKKSPKSRPKRGKASRGGRGQES